MCVSRRLLLTRAVVHGVVVAQARLSPDKSSFAAEVSLSICEWVITIGNHTLGKTEAAGGVNEAGGQLSRSHPNGG